MEKPAVIRDLRLNVFSGITPSSYLVEFEFVETFEKLWLHHHVDPTPFVFHVIHVSGLSCQ
jgi:hypothetical protein